MTSEEYDKLTDRERRIKIAECAGLTLDGWLECGTKRKSWACPDFANDLNAMHEVEKTIPEELRGVYQYKLFTVLQGLENVTYNCIPCGWDFLRAEPGARAKAFVLTMTEDDDE